MLFCFEVDAGLIWAARQATTGATGKSSVAPLCEESTATRHFLFRDQGDAELNEGYHRKVIEALGGWIAQHPDDVFVRLDRIRYADDKEDRGRQIAHMRRVWRSIREIRNTNSSMPRRLWRLILQARSHD